jgi:transposase-like protein/IS1 family transposase
MQCPICNNEGRKFGRDRDGNQRFQCVACRKTFSERPDRVLGSMRLDLDKAIQCLRHLLEGVSVRATMRLVGVNRNTILDLLVLVGERCERMLDGRIHRVPVVDVQCDEIWGFVGMKEKRRLATRADEAGIGDAYCFIGIERETKLILAWHLGRRSKEDTEDFADKLAFATSGRFQITTDGYTPYLTAIPASLPNADFAQLVKQYATKDDHRYSPGEVIGTEKVSCCGSPDLEKICTSHIERQNLTIRMQNRRMTRLTNAFSKKWDNHRYAMALHFAGYNFVTPHGTLTKRAEGVKTTPAMASGLADHPWTVEELLIDTAKSTQS